MDQKVVGSESDMHRKLVANESKMSRTFIDSWSEMRRICVKNGLETTQCNSLSKVSQWQVRQGDQP